MYKDTTVLCNQTQNDPCFNISWSSQNIVQRKKCFIL